MELKHLLLPMSNVVLEENLNENDSCGGIVTYFFHHEHSI